MRLLPLSFREGAQASPALLNVTMKVMREIALFVMLSFVSPAVNAMGVVSALRPVIAFNVIEPRASRTRQRTRRYGVGAVHTEFTFVHYYVAS